MQILLLKIFAIYYGVGVFLKESAAAIIFLAGMALKKSSIFSQKVVWQRAIKLRKSVV